MRTITREEYFDLCKRGSLFRQVDEWKESVQILNAEGKPTMVISYQPPQPPCSCKPSDRRWECLACDGYVTTESNGKVSK